jgi:hypothetical protein
MSKKLTLSLTLILFCFKINYAQNDESSKSNTKYRYKFIYIIAADENGDKITKPLGKDVNIFIDDFYKTVEVTYLDENDAINTINMSFINKKSEMFNLMKDKNNVYYYVLNKATKDKFAFIMAEKQKGLMITFDITNELKN